jgi:3'-5' exoribonuclease
VSKAKKPPLVKLSELQPGQFADSYAQLAEKSRHTARDGRPFYTCRFRDPRKSVGVLIWADSPLFHECQDRWQAGAFFKLRGTYAEHPRYGPQMDVELVRPIEDRDREDGFKEADFVERSRFDSEAMLQELDALIVTEIQDVPLRHLTQKLLQDHAAELKELPASARHAYPFAGGWLEHTLGVVKSCVFLAGHYSRQFPELKPALNRDLIVAAAVLHDIGRVRALAPGPPGQPPATRLAGELFGHIHLGYDLIRTAAAGVPDLDPERLELLLHLVVAPVRQPESSSARPPRIPEALILHHATELDASFEMHVRCLLRDAGDGPFTERDPILGRSLLKQRKV